MKSLSILTLIFTFFSCSVPISNSNFREFCSNFQEISFPFQINDSITFKNWNSEDLIDTNYVKKYELLSQHTNKDYPLKLQDYKCSSVGRYYVGDYVAIMYKTYTTEAGRGNPEIILATFTLHGKKKDEITALWNDAEDPLYSQRVTLDIFNVNTVLIKSLVKYNGYLDGRIVPNKVTEKTISYEIEDGVIVKKMETVKDIFIDNNPEILNDFPNE